MQVQSTKMTSKEMGRQLTQSQIVSLATMTSITNMMVIAEGYMDISDETIKNLQYENKGQAEAFNREIIKYWAKKNPVDQVQVHIIGYFLFYYLPQEVVFTSH